MGTTTRQPSDGRGSGEPSDIDGRGADPSGRPTSCDFTVSVPVDHPAFAGHFPGHPVLPGVVLLAEVLAGAERGLGVSMDRIVIKVAKFHAPVAPGASLVVRLVPGNAITFSVSCGETQVASGAIAVDMTPVGETSGGAQPSTSARPS